MAIHGISRDLLGILFELGREHHPNEFIAVLRERDGIIRDLDLVPGTTVGEESASFFVDMLPLDVHQAGSAHSHPNGVLSPSPADLRFFPTVGRYHIIVGYPYGKRDWRCYRADGSVTTLEVVE
ncbi:MULTISPECIES: Mov34/MPN/PAD-1 family protein [unclassified Methanoculleus]|jgi:proteasome lid subunit RPN8/RPN11|uniref:Mov34/MPN/PAD-1 family protein n=2 Tax=Methanoculleus TaxID=45989 RepID=A0ABD8A9B5_9EURY|nr:Mov34/MPN/PAD-1 family protein [Methanoculleus palmolei]